MNESTRQSTLNPRLVLVVLFVLFLAPVLVAIVMNSRWVEWQPEPTKNYGELITPVVAVPAGLRELLPADQWILLAAFPECSAKCTRDIDHFERIDRALGRHGESLAPVLVLDAATPTDLPAHVEVIADGGVWRAFLAELNHESGSVVLIDPLGNLMMSFPRDFDASAMKDDLERLIKYSRFEAS
ncbi:MAG: hypothetical protein R3200_05560 [Xanthomonadales bacterium]|nr:hypothetical protein [Xanthomonadales bacterium]